MNNSSLVESIKKEVKNYYQIILLINLLIKDVEKINNESINNNKKENIINSINLIYTIFSAKLDNSDNWNNSIYYLFNSFCEEIYFLPRYGIEYKKTKLSETSKFFKKNNENNINFLNINTLNINILNREDNEYNKELRLKLLFYNEELRLKLSFYKDKKYINNLKKYINNLRNNANNFKNPTNLKNNANNFKNLTNLKNNANTILCKNIYQKILEKNCIFTYNPYKIENTEYNPFIKEMQLKNNKEQIIDLIKYLDIKEINNKYELLLYNIENCIDFSLRLHRCCFEIHLSIKY